LTANFSDFAFTLDTTVFDQVGLKSQQGWPKPEHVRLSSRSHPLPHFNRCPGVDAYERLSLCNEPRRQFISTVPTTDCLVASRVRSRLEMCMGIGQELNKMWEWEWESTSTGMEMAPIPMGIDSHQRLW